MKIICLVKFVPDVAEFRYDYQKDRIDRSQSKQIINPDDATALAWALKQKKRDPSIQIEVVSMGPLTMKEKLENLIRLGVDQGTLITDRAFQGSDSYATSVIIAAYLTSTDYDLILSGSHTIDGGTGHIGPQLAERLGIDQFTDVLQIFEFQQGRTSIQALVDETVLELSLLNPCLLSVTAEMKEPLGFATYDNRDRNVEAQFQLVTNTELELALELVGRKGSPTKVRKNVVKKRKKQPKMILKNDEAGIEYVYQFLVERGYLDDV